MFIGVIFYSSILTELLSLIQKKIQDQEKIQKKIHLLKEVMLETKVPGKIAKEMERAIYDSFAAMDDTKIELKFDGVNKKDLE